MNLLYLSCHSIAEFLELRLFTDLQVTCISQGTYNNPDAPASDTTRPKIDSPYLPYLPDLNPLAKLEWVTRIDPIPEKLIDWADVILTHGIERWLPVNWERMKRKHVVFRCNGQSVAHTESVLAKYRAQGLKVVRYSPVERYIPGYCGEDAVIRFYADETEYKDWNGAKAEVVTVAQSMKQREAACKFSVFDATTQGFPRKVYGIGNADLGGLWGGKLPYDELKAVYRDNRAFVYTGTCLPTGSMVLVGNEFRPIESITTQESVRGRSGLQTAVLAATSRHFEGDLVEVKPRFLEGAAFTPEHLVLVNELSRYYNEVRELGQTVWKPATDLKCWSDAVVIPKSQTATVSEIFVDFGVPKGVQSKIKGKLRLDEDLAELFGWYVSEGCPSVHGVLFNLGGDEDEDVARIAELIKKLNHVPYVVKYERESRGGFSTRIWLTSARFRDFTVQNFGRGAKNKKIPGFLFEANPAVKQAFLRGVLRGDGYPHTRNHGKPHWRISSASYQLIKQLQMLLLSIGRVSSVIKASERKRLSTIKGRTIRSGPQWTLDFLDAEHHQKLYLEDERNFYFPIARLARKPYRGLVHDITTGEGSFSVPFVVHNCPAPYTLAFMEAWMTGQPVVAAGPALMGFNVETPYLIENGVDGFVYGSVSQMRDAVGRLLADRDAAAEMGKAGRESAIRFFGYAPIKAAWKRFFDSL